MINLAYIEFELGWTTNIIALFLLGILGLYSVRTFSLKNKSYRPFYLIYLVSLLEVLTHLLTVIVQYPKFFGINGLGIFMYSFVYTVDCIYIISWIYYLNHSLFRLMHPDDSYRNKFILLVMPIGVMLALSIVNMFTPVFFSYQNFQYRRLPLYYLTLLIPIAYLLYGMAAFFRAKNRRQVYKVIPIAQLLLPVVTAHVVEWVFLGECVIPLSHVITFMVLVLNNEKLKVAEDELTGMYTRRELYSYLETLSHSSRSLRKDSQTVGIMMDLDNFKNINDLYGHVVGDSALTDFGRILYDQLPHNGMGFRYAGDEFVVILEHSDKAAAERLVSRMEKALLEFNAKAEAPYRLSATAGITSWRKTDSVQTFIAHLDQSMYQNKADREQEEWAGRSAAETMPMQELIDDTFFRTLTSFNHDMALFITDIETGETIWSDNVLDFFDFPENYQWHSEESVKERIHPDDAEMYTESLINILRRKSTTQLIQYRVADGQGKYHWIQSNGRIRKDEHTGKEYFSGSLMRMDNTESRDTLTNLLTMDYFLALAAGRVQSDTQSRGLCVVYFDIKNFKMVNIERGLQNGNLALRQVALLLKKYFPHDPVSRFSGDHFVVLTTVPGVEDIIRELQKEMSRMLENTRLILKAGVYLLKDTDRDIALACDLAKAAVDDIKNMDENIYVFDERLERKLTIERYILQNIDEAVKQHWLRVYYQPILRTATGTICGYEALARWMDPVYGFLSPADFIPVLEGAGEIYKLDSFVVREVCGLIRRCREEKIPMVPVSINLSRMDVEKTDVVSFFDEVTKEFDVPVSMLNIEITESMAMSDQEAAQECIRQLRARGYQVWMDDFGSGYSSLHALTNLEFDEIKLDREFMRDFGDNSKKIVMSMIAMAKKMGLSTLTEGVETREQLEFLRSIGCEKAQGFLIGRPAPFEDVLRQRGQTGIPIEIPEEIPYYDSLGAVDFMTAQAFAITEYDTEGGKALYISRELADLLLECELSLEDLLTAPNLQETGSQIEYEYRGWYLQLRNTVLSERGSRALCHLEIVNTVRI